MQWKFLLYTPNGSLCRGSPITYRTGVVEIIVPLPQNLILFKPSGKALPKPATPMAPRDNGKKSKSYVSHPPSAVRILLAIRHPRI